MNFGRCESSDRQNRKTSTRKPNSYGAETNHQAVLLQGLDGHVTAPWGFALQNRGGWIYSRTCVTNLRSPRLASCSASFFFGSLQPSFNLLPSIEVLAEITRLIRETIECDQLLIGVRQTASLPATLCPRNPK